MLPRERIASLDDGRLEIDGETRWVEIVGVYVKSSEAKQIWKSVTPGEDPVPRERPLNPATTPRCFHEQLLDQVKKKISKSSYESIVKNWGPGILICKSQDPTLNYDWQIERGFVEPEFQGLNLEFLRSLNDGRFREVYLYAWETNRNKFYHLCSL